MAEFLQAFDSLQPDGRRGQAISVSITIESEADPRTLFCYACGASQGKAVRLQRMRKPPFFDGTAARDAAGGSRDWLGTQSFFFFYLIRSEYQIQRLSMPTLLG
jgi:hypothetical protein